MDFENSAPDWAATGTEPEDSLKSTGFTAGYKPPASIFNWFWTKVSNCISELQSKLSSVDDAKADVDHASSGTTYGVGDASNYGHVKLYDTASSSYNSDDGLAATPAAVATRAPTSHRSSATTYGTGTGSYYGHVKLSDSVTGSSYTQTVGIAATPYAVYLAQTAADNAQTTADNAQTAADSAQTAADNAQTAADNAQTAADNAAATAVSVGRFYGVCDTARATTAKTVEADGFTLTDGAMITVKFTNGIPKHTTITLDVNGTGAKYITQNNIDNWSSVDFGMEQGSMLTFVYDAETDYYVLINEYAAYSYTAHFSDYADALIRTALSYDEDEEALTIATA